MHINECLINYVCVHFTCALGTYRLNTKEHVRTFDWDMFLNYSFSMTFTFVICIRNHTENLKCFLEIHSTKNSTTVTILSDMVQSWFFRHYKNTYYLIRILKILKKDSYITNSLNKIPATSLGLSQGVFIYRRADEITKKFGYIWL